MKYSKASFVFLSGLLTFLGRDAWSQEFTKDQAKEIKSIVRTYLVENPDIVEEAIGSLQKWRETRKKIQIQKSIQKNRAALFDVPNDHFLGNPGGQRHIVAFLDPICGHCRHFYEVLSKAAEEDKNLKIILKDVPFLGQPALLFSKFLLAAGLQGKYLSAYKLLHQAKPTTEEKEIFKMAETLVPEGLDLEQFKQDFKSEKVLKKLQENLNLASSIGIEATPSFVIQKDLFSGYVKLEDLKKLLAGKSL